MSSKAAGKRPVKIHGELEIDPLRGVIYFHCGDPKWAEKFLGLTILRISSLPKPIPLKAPMLDITHMFGTSWSSQERNARAAETAAIEFGYRCCEKGMNLQATLQEAQKQTQEETETQTGNQ